MSFEKIQHELDVGAVNFQGKELWIFGAGNTAALYYNGLLRLEKEGLYIFGYIDNDPNKWNKTFNGKNVVPLKSLKFKKDKIFILICSTKRSVVKSIKIQLLEQGFDNFCYIDEAILKLHKEKVLQVYNLLDDEKSKTIYEVLLLERLHCSGAVFPHEETEQYFSLSEFMLHNPQEVYVDCGSYVGDTIEKYIWMRNGVFKKIVGFEPDDKNYKAMLYRIERLELEWGIPKHAIEVYKKGVADRSAKGRSERDTVNNGLSSKIISDDSGNEFFIISLDQFLKEPYSFLKADVEGWEYKLLIGAKNGIKANKPLIAVCIYHNAVDFYEIPLLLHEIVPEYKLAIRHHSNTLDETVLYAWIDNIC